MKKILIIIKNNTLTFKEKKKLKNEYRDLINTNIISSNELLFSDEYIESNPKIISSFIEELTKTYQINTIIINNLSITELILNVIKDISSINSLIVKDNVPLTFKVCELINNSHIKNVNCYSLQTFMLELLDKNKISVESRSEILFSSNFMSDNNLNTYSSLFYKMTLVLNFPFNDQDEEDFKTFCKINKYLKTIHVSQVSKSDLEFIVESLRIKNKKNVRIIIHDNISDFNTIDYLKNFNKKYSKKYKINFKLDYSDSYLSENLIKETNNSILKLCGTFIIFIIAISFSYVFYDNYKSMKGVNDIQNDIQKVIEVTDTEEIVNKINDELNNENVKVVNEDIASLLTINPDVVGWLKVNNTNIDYPTVQYTDNSYYLSHNLYSKEDLNGWVFTDYRNKFAKLSDNIIFYAHNRYHSGVMFGTLQNALRYSWYTDPENQIITFKTLYGTYNYKLFSVYRIYKTNDYLATAFEDDAARFNFYNMLKNRSIYDFNVEVTGTDKIITLSTCSNTDYRIVVHAVLQK